jgi:plasmid maintenance system antidote protein VapI
MAESSTVGQRIAQLIQQLGLSKNAFAISLDKTATVIQHLVEERNKPGFDLLCKIFEVYPNVSKDWLMQGAGPMWENIEAASAATKAPETSTPIAAAPASVAPSVEVPTEPIQQASVTPTSSPEPVVASTGPVPTPELIPAAPAASPPTAQPSIVEPTAAPTPAVPATPAVDAGAWQTALYTQQMAHQLALAEMRNQHMQEQQRLMQQMMDLMQRQLAK